ncbi:MAG: DUF354 domain-containing protein, partial [Bacteroidetes bacterium]|nr:DUF354 domain-containing protein [Bacteroidota bacterium]
MTILFTMVHPAHVNFFKNAIKILESAGHKVIIISIKRGKLPAIVKKELPETEVHFISRHRGTRWSIIMEANLLRDLNLFFFHFRRRQVNLAITGGDFFTGFMFKYIFRKPNIQFDDDPERTFIVNLEKRTATELYFPFFIEPFGTVKVFRALKEWSYLSPRYFIPRTDVLDVYGVKPKEYIFIREISTGSFNYKGQTENIVASFAARIPKHVNVLLSLEDKKTSNQYPTHWTILQEPIECIHSLIYHSALLISSGDSMAREGSMLGVPSVYCGERTMKANEVMIREGMLKKLNPEETLAFIQDFFEGKCQVPSQDIFRKRLLEEWEDVTKLICSFSDKYS